MSRIRSIKPEFWSSEQVMACSPTARLLFIGLWNFCDDEGRHPYSLKQLRALILPGDDFTTDDIARMFDELSANGLLARYTVDDKEYFYITGWSHQKIDKPQKPKYPAPVVEHSPNPRDGIQRGGDRKGVEVEAKASSASAPSSVHPIDARTALFTEGLSALSELSGRPQQLLRGIVGKWVQTSGGDHGAVLSIIRAAVAQQIIDPVAWITKGLKPKDPDAEIYRNVL
jgi:hypothetical protein